MCVHVLRFIGCLIRESVKRQECIYSAARVETKLRRIQFELNNPIKSCRFVGIQGLPAMRANTRQRRNQFTFSMETSGL